MSEVLTRLTAALADRYRVERELGAGGMATVWLAHDLRHGRDVAIKVLHPDLGAALGGERFLAEIRTTAKLQHPHILPLLDSGDADGLLYYVMPLVSGETLRARLERERQLPVADAVRLAKEVAAALDHAHRQGVIHRDIKPENILLQDGSALVADFGIALAVQQAGGQRMTQTGLSLGTPQYMSPEQAMGERTIDARSDVYALGAVTYEMLVGEPPFTGPSVQAIVARLVSEEPRGLVAQRKAIPDHVEAAVLGAMEKLPADRFATAAEFAAALDGTRTVTTRSTAARRPVPRVRAREIVLGALAVALGIAAALAWSRPTVAPEVVRYRVTIDSVPAARSWAGELAISPDGATIVRSGGPNGALLVRRRDEFAFTVLEGTRDAEGPFFSADGTQVAYFGDHRFMAVPLAGGPAVILADSLGTLESATWSADGQLFRDGLASGARGIVRQAARPGAPVEQVTTVDTAGGEQLHHFPQVLPDGRTLLFGIQYSNGRRVIAVLDIGTQSHRVLVDGVRARYSPSGHLIYTTPDGKLWAAPFDVRSRALTGTASLVAERIPASIVGPVDFAVSASGTLVYSADDVGTRRELVWVDRNGARTPFDPAWKGDFSSPVLSPDGTRVAVSLREDAQSHIWIKAVGGGTATRLTVQHRSNTEPAWTPDGRMVTWLAGETNTGDVWRQSADGGGVPERIVRSERPLSEQVWSPATGELVVRTTTPTAGAGDVLRVRRDASPALEPLVATPLPEYSPIPSPDGRWLAFVSNASGRLEVNVVPFATPASARWTVSTAGGLAPRWSRKGDELFFLDGQSNLVAARITTTPTFAVQSTRVLFSARDFVQPSVSRRNYDVSPDAERFLMVQRADGAKGGQVVVVEHWAEEMRRRRTK